MTVSLKVCVFHMNKAQVLQHVILSCEVEASQDVVFEGVKRVCEPGAGWVEPIYSDLSGYGEERCDGLDDDYDGEVDESFVRSDLCNERLPFDPVP